MTTIFNDKEVFIVIQETKLLIFFLIRILMRVVDI